MFNLVDPSLVFLYTSLDIVVVILCCQKIPSIVHRRGVCESFWSIHQDQLMKVFKLSSTSEKIKAYEF